MKNISTLFLGFIFSFVTALSTKANEFIFKLEPEQKAVGTFSGDINQESTVHLIVIKDKNADDYKIKPFFIDRENAIIELDEVSFSEEPSVISYHFDKRSNNLTLLLKQKKEDVLELLDFNVDSKKITRSSFYNYKDEYLLIRLEEKTLLINKEESTLEIITIKNSQKSDSVFYTVEGDNLHDFKTIFKTQPEIINTSEYVEHGSINPSKIYYHDNKLIFDNSSEKEYIVMSVDTERQVPPSFRKYLFDDYGKVRDVNAYVHNNQTFLFINNKEDIHLKSYDLKTEEVVLNTSLKKDLSNYLNEEDLNKLIKKSSRKGFSLTGTINEGTSNNLVINIDYVPTNKYQYNYNWWWHFDFFHQQMMWNQQQIMNQMQVPRFGPNPVLLDEIDAVYTTESKSVKLVLDKDLNFIPDAETSTLRPSIDKDRYIKPFEKNRRINDVTMAFTSDSARIIYYSKDTESFHLKSTIINPVVVERP